MADPHALELIQEEKHEEFNAYVASREQPVDLTDAHLRSYDLRKFNLRRANFSGAYLRATDLRALDLSEAKFDKASFKDAKISGVLFPRDFSAAEITMSLLHGTRIRQGL